MNNKKGDSDWRKERKRGGGTGITMGCEDKKKKQTKRKKMEGWRI